MHCYSSRVACSKLTPQPQAQTLEQRRRNAKFAKTQENRMGKSEDQIKAQKAKEVQKSPISLIWIVILGFIVFGGLIFEAFEHFFGK
ncbi:unnamed protein product [Clonostachys byssicola]|uniref:Stress-associated endoplasmic reticulum protein n=1 Tax=Clonostachys byssicola TaxID=160290 RepID=A0A9N9YBP5_9HYPO|nr:unnamed protein product [Clonostachys byssicola]